MPRNRLLKRLVGQADTIPAHVGSLPTRIGAILEKFPLDTLDEGDVIIMNDPYYGGLHTPDVTVMKVIRRGELVFLPIALGHWSDVGGMRCWTGERRQTAKHCKLEKST